MLGVLGEDEVFSDCENRPSNPVDHSDVSQRPVGAAEKGNRRVSAIEDNREFNFKLFNNEFTETRQGQRIKKRESRIKNLRTKLYSRIQSYRTQRGWGEGLAIYMF